MTDVSNIVRWHYFFLLVFTVIKAKRIKYIRIDFILGSIWRLIFHDLLFLHVIIWLKFHNDWCQKLSSISVTLFLLAGLQWAFFKIIPTVLGEKDTLKIRTPFACLLIIYSWIERVSAQDDITLTGGNFPRGDKTKSVHLLIRDNYHIHFSFKIVKYLEDKSFSLQSKMCSLFIKKDWLHYLQH